ncbi:LAMI_0C07008g1_1 [Lachancea mirantina]|uniref:RNA helicase n=1 Tax=Lachancea mirantina TaxID=1230905 RepID=A0A1G4J3J7_9SACH|nr:LAMI_0C07008g1_1 [Lachancea mirantina]
MKTGSVKRKGQNLTSKAPGGSKHAIPVNPETLKWKPVEIPDTLDDFEGLYGVEEIDGVSVKIIDGKAQFFAKDGSKIDLDANRSVEAESMVDFKGFKNMDDMEDGELEADAGSKDNLDETDPSDINVDDDNKDSGDELKENVFALAHDIPNIEHPTLPEWTEKMNLSTITLLGLAKQGFTKPTEIQSMAIPRALDGKDIMGKASTGSGKTLAYGIPIFEALLNQKSGDDPIALIFTPTRELAHQVTQHLEKLAYIATEKSPHLITSLTGGLAIQKQERILKYKGGSKIVVATPGRFLELIERDANLIKRFAQISFLVLDEADRLLQDGHFDEFEKILRHLRNERKIKKKFKSEYANSGWQTMIFSATFSLDLFNKLSAGSWKKTKPGEGDNEMELALKHLMTKIHFKSKPEIIDANPKFKITSKIKESLIECLPTERDLYTYYFNTVYPGTTLVFCNAIDSVKKLNAYLNLLGINSYQIHSSMTQKNRLASLEKFQKQARKNQALDKSTILIASDVAARGLDIPGVQHVLHYHLPRTADVYIHRSGRTARAENEGVSVTICSPDEAIGPLRKLRKALASQGGFEKGKKWQKDVPLFPVEPDIVSQLRERSRIANELAEDEIATRSLSKDDNWMKKAAEDLGVELDSDDDSKDVFLAKNKAKKLGKKLDKSRAHALRYELKLLLDKPIRKDLRKSYLTGGLVNLADHLVKKRGHASIIGHEKVDALNLLKKKNKKQKHSTSP